MILNVPYSEISIFFVIIQGTPEIYRHSNFIIRIEMNIYELDYEILLVNPELG